MVEINRKVMKNTLFVIAGLLIIIWAIVVWGFDSSGIIDMLLVFAGFIILVRILFNKQLSDKKRVL